MNGKGYRGYGLEMAAQQSGREMPVPGYVKNDVQMRNSTRGSKPFSKSEIKTGYRCVK